MQGLFFFSSGVRRGEGVCPLSPLPLSPLLLSPFLPLPLAAAASTSATPLSGFSGFEASEACQALGASAGESLSPFGILSPFPGLSGLFGAAFTFVPICERFLSTD